MEGEPSSIFTYCSVKHDVSLKTIGYTELCSYFIPSFLYAFITSERIVDNELASLAKEEFQNFRRHQICIIIIGCFKYRKTINSNNYLIL